MTSAKAMSAREILQLERKPKDCLASQVRREAEADAAARGHTIKWLIGGPEKWSKDELVSHLVQTENARRRLGVTA